MLNSGRITVELHANAIGLLDNVLIGNDVALRIDDDAGTQ